VFFVVYIWAIMLPVMINSPLQCSVEQTCWTYIKFILWCHFVNSNTYVHFYFSHTHLCKPHHPLICLLLIHKLSLMNCLEIPLPQYINQITQPSNLTPFKIVSHDFPQPSGTKFVRIWKSYINQTDLRKACYSKECFKCGENKWSHCLPQSLTNTFISLHDFILFSDLYLKTKTIKIDRSNTQRVNYNVRMQNNAV